MAKTKEPKEQKPLAKQEPAKPKTQKEQSERFVKAAREIECDESGEVFEKAFALVTSGKNAGH